VSWNLDVVYPYPFNSLLSLLSIFSFDFLSSACMFPKSSNLLSEVYMWSAVPVALSCCMFTSYLIQSIYLGADTDELRSRHTYYVLLMSYLALPSVSLKQFQVRPFSWISHIELTNFERRRLIVSLSLVVDS
jgi:hypothetical protein